MINKRTTRLRENAQRKLLRAASDIFTAHGFDGASTRAIADRAGVNVALIAYHFNGKEGLFDAVLSDWVGGLTSAIGRALPGLSDGTVRTEAIVGAFLRYSLIEAPGPAGLIARESICAERSAASHRTDGALRPAVSLLDTLLPTCETQIAGGKEFLGLLLRLAVPMPSLDGVGPEVYHRARTRALALLRLHPSHPPVSQPVEPPVAATPTPSPASIGLDFVD